ncbi:MAG: NAD(P)H-hydrate dehydratase [Nitrospirales bacterium]|nr:NAD(P)H-hydrate dehydratase [Nitrospirales bacterium]
MKIVTAAQMHGLDRRTIEEAGIAGTTLMEHAGQGLATCLEKTFGSPTGKRVTIVCGKGNNGGDGLVLARILHQQQSIIRVLLLSETHTLTHDAQTMYQRFIELAGPTVISTLPSAYDIQETTTHSELIVDALLGTGITADVQGLYRTAIEAMNASRVPVLAVDLPSGIHADNGTILGVAVRATLTVTFGYPKLGLYLGEAIDYTGKIIPVDIGIPPHYIESMAIDTHLLSRENTFHLIPARPMSSHKGRFGHAAIIAGSIGKTGAAALAAKAALRIGTGLVTVATPTSANAILEGQVLEAMTTPMPETPEGTLAQTAFETLRIFTKNRTAVAIGPGLSTHAETAEVIRSLLPELDCPCVIDADALNALAGQPELLQTCSVQPIVTPHPGEMARLVGEVSPQAVNQDRLGIARRFARQTGAIVILKGARTIVAGPDGKAAICPAGNPGMATAGMGDVLTGTVVGLLAQGLSPWNAACLGVYLHGLAGDLASQRWGQPGLIAGDVLETLPHIFNKTFPSGL